MKAIDAATYRGWAKELGDLEEQVDAVQEAKRSVYASNSVTATIGQSRRA